MGHNSSFAQALLGSLADHEQESLHTLPQGRVTSFVAQRGQVLRVCDGTVWLTFGTADDVILSRGEQFVVSAQTLVVAQAVTAAVFHLS